MSSNYGYTLAPVPFELSVEQQRQAQLELAKQGNKIRKKEWLIMGVFLAIAIVGFIFTKGYSTILWWLIVILLAVYLLVRTKGLQFYIKKQLEQQNMTPITGVKLGVQPSGIVMIQKVGAHEGRGQINWTDIYEWRETPDYIFIFFKQKGQSGGYPIPKSLAAKKFPIDTVVKHLKETVGPASTTSTLTG